MAELPPEIAGLIEAARSAHDPSDADCERVRRGLQAAIVAQASTAAAATPDGAASAASHGGLGSLVSTTGGKLLLAVALMGGATGLWSWRSRGESPRATPASETQHAQADEPASPPAASVETLRAQTARIDEPASPPAASVQGSSGSAGDAGVLDRTERLAARGRVERRAARGRTDPVQAEAPPSDPANTARGGHATESGEPSREPVADQAVQDALAPAPVESEVTLIRAALRSLNAGAPQRALELLDAHAVRHPAGAMARERAGLRVLALCTAGRWHEGRLEQAAFLDSASDSPLQKRVRNACKDQPK